MSTKFTLLPDEHRDGNVRIGEPLAKHFLQQTGYTCGAASVSMILGLTESECAKLAQTTRAGTNIVGAAEAFRKAGKLPHVVYRNCPFEHALPELMVQSLYWPLYLSLEFVHEGTDSIGRKRKSIRHHACVMSRQKFFDPGEWHELDPEALGHLHQRGIFLNAYIIVETPLPDL